MEQKDRITEPKIEYKAYSEALIHYLVHAVHKITKGRKTFNFNPENEKIIHALTLYGTKNQKFEELGKNFSLEKGILIIGNFGSGKTLFMKAYKALNQHFYKKDTGFITCEDLVQKFREYNHDLKKIGGYEALKVYSNKYDKVERIFDDIGEEKEILDYGNKIDVVSYILKEREKGIQNEVITHGTSNLSIPGFKKRYDGRIESRIHTLFNVLYLGIEPDSIDYRKFKNEQ